MKFFTISAATILIALASAAPSFASDTESEHGHEYHKNSLFGFVGITGEERRDRAITLAVEYERRFNERWGLSAGIEHAFGDLNFTVITVPVVLHSGQWAFYAGPGVEFQEHHDDELLFRFGAAYEFEVGNVILAPKVNVDIVDGHVVMVGGLAIGFGF